MRIVQLSDSHISHEHPARTAELEACIGYINALEQQPDVVVHTGDIAHNGLAEEYATARRIMDRLSTPYFVIGGNRDNRAQLIDAFSGGGHAATRHGFLQFSVEDFDVRLICIDTVSDHSNKGRLCALRRSDVEAMLRSDTARPAVLCMHHPPFEASVAPDPRQYEDWQEVVAFTEMISQFGHIRGVYCGHIHRFMETRIASLPATVLSCIASDLRWDNAHLKDAHQPIVKLHHVLEQDRLATSGAP